MGCKQDHKIKLSGSYIWLLYQSYSGYIYSACEPCTGYLQFYCYVEYKGASHGGANEYLQNYAAAYIFGGGEPSLYQFVSALTIEGFAASMIVSFALMQYWKDKVEKINKVDDVAHNQH
ncbi:MAG: hypothetical protein DI539_02700 [Flavobacterium psychrophilum]|nr:MAG: hypothetical protein DI539_02700 [Flavobacterium psychrophilum]